MRASCVYVCEKDFKLCERKKFKLVLLQFRTLCLGILANFTIFRYLLIIFDYLSLLFGQFSLIQLTGFWLFSLILLILVNWVPTIFANSANFG